MARNAHRAARTQLCRTASENFGTDDPNTLAQLINDRATKWFGSSFSLRPGEVLNALRSAGSITQAQRPGFATIG
jgi:hypothetical protein